jgi:hypothetical protein
MPSLRSTPHPGAATADHTLERHHSSHAAVLPRRRADYYGSTRHLIKAGLIVAVRLAAPHLLQVACRNLVPIFGCLSQPDFTIVTSFC